MRVPSAILFAIAFLALPFAAKATSLQEDRANCLVHPIPEGVIRLTANWNDGVTLATRQQEIYKMPASKFRDWMGGNEERAKVLPVDCIYLGNTETYEFVLGRRLDLALFFGFAPGGVQVAEWAPHDDPFVLPPAWNRSFPNYRAIPVTNGRKHDVNYLWCFNKNGNHRWTVSPPVRTPDLPNDCNADYASQTFYPIPPSGKN